MKLKLNVVEMEYEDHGINADGLIMDDTWGVMIKVHEENMVRHKKVLNKYLDNFHFMSSLSREKEPLSALDVRNFNFANGVRWPLEFTDGEVCHHSVEFASGLNVIFLTKEHISSRSLNVDSGKE
ncbi:hypothetical protein LXL04_020769 [Taraxacum kok-saghyz]